MLQSQQSRVSDPGNDSCNPPTVKPNIILPMQAPTSTPVLKLNAGAEFQEVGSRSFDERSTERLAAVHVVTAAEAAAGTFSIEDVVLPLPGAKVEYPQHESAQVGCLLPQTPGRMVAHSRGCVTKCCDLRMLGIMFKSCSSSMLPMRRYIHC